MSDYRAVQAQLAKGVDPRFLCMTCPWDRFCITPPTKTQADVDAEIARAQEQDAARAEQARTQGQEGGMPVGTLLTALVFGNAANSCQVCPVLALRLRLSEGRALVENIRTQMQAVSE